MRFLFRAVIILRQSRKDRGEIVRIARRAFNIGVHYGPAMMAADVSELWPAAQWLRGRCDQNARKLPSNFSEGIARTLEELR